MRYMGDLEYLTAIVLVVWLRYILPIYFFSCLLCLVVIIGFVTQVI